MAENAEKGSAGTEYNLDISPDSIKAAAVSVDSIVTQIKQTYSAINQQIGVVLNAWMGPAADLHVKLYNEDAELYNAYENDISWEAVRLSMVGDSYEKVEQSNTEKSGVLSGDIF